MAGIEKICEFSGEYPGYLMYGYKKNQLQIMPEYRKRFRGAKAILHIFTPEIRWQGRGKRKWTQSYDLHMMDWYEPPFTNVKEFEAYYSEEHNCRLNREYTFTLEVFDDSLKGDVNGLYTNWSSEISTVKRKMKRLLRCKELNIVQHNCTYSEWRNRK